MKVTFNLKNYTAGQGEQIYVIGSLPQLGDRANPTPMSYTKQNQKVTVTFEKYETGTYRYFTDNQDDVITRHMPVFIPGAEIVINDDFSPSRRTPWYSSAFEVISAKKSAPTKFTGTNSVVRVFVPYPCETVSMTTSLDWNNKVEMVHIGNRYYEAVIQSKPFEYKFVLNGSEWETGANRLFTPINNSITSHFFNYEHSPKTRFTGINTPVFSLRTKNSVGCGEFSDIKPLSDLCNKTGIRLIQILPINDTQCENDWRDSYPYSGISVFAMHPMYVSLSEIEGAESFKAEIEAAKKKCAGSEVEMDYELTIAAKMDILKKIYEKNMKKYIPLIESWIKNTRDVDYWIYSYCVFKYLTDYFKTIDFNQWTKNDVYDHAHFIALSMEDKQEYLKKIFVAKQTETYFYAFIQYVLDQQLLSASTYARENGVFLKGDIPIGVNPISVDTWDRTDLFNMDTCTGAPPDQFSATGQNWGFPTYNWDQMRENENFGWWSARFRSMERYFDSFRIDHVLGWFRIWEIPGECVKGNGRLGHFAPCDPVDFNEINFWDRQRLTQPLLEKQNVIPELCDVQTWTWLEDNGFFTNDSVQGRRIFALNERKSVDRARQMIKSDEQFLVVKEAIVLLNANRAIMQDKANDQKFHPIFCNLVPATETPSFKALNEDIKTRLRQIAEHYFFKAHGDIWAKTASERLPIIGRASNMLIIGEDLGLLSEVVPRKMEEFGLLGLRVHNMPSNPQQTFQDNSNYSWMTVCTPGTHDCPSLRSWWSRQGEQVEEYWRTQLSRHDDGWKRDLSVQDSLNIVKKLLHTDSMISMFLIQDWTAITEKTRYQGEIGKEDINHPEVAEWYWRYRMPMTLEDLQSNKEFCDLVRSEIDKSGRII